MIIDDVCQETGLNYAQFARLIGVSDGYLHDLRTGRRELSIKVAAKIERATGRTGVVDDVVKHKTAA